MTPECDKSQIMSQLKDARRDIATNMCRRNRLLIEQVADAIDQVQPAEARDLAISQLEGSARRLREIDETMHRLDNGKYGACANCDGEIELKRLRAMPWARFCLNCQEIADREQFGRSGAEKGFLNAA